MSPSTDVADREWTVTLDGKPWASAARYEVENPTTGRPLTSAPDLSEEEVGRAVAAAQAAQPAWGAMPPRARAAVIRQLAATIREHREELATLDALDGGFTLSMMRGDVDAAAELMEIFADMALDLGGRTIPVSTNLHYTMQVPYGVVARIGAFNHPFFFAAFVGRVRDNVAAARWPVREVPKSQTPVPYSAVVCILPQKKKKRFFSSMLLHVINGRKIY